MPIRFSGMATGMDTEGLIKQLMTAKRAPIDKMKQQQAKLEWTRDQYRDMNALITAFRDAADSTRYNYNMLAKKATSSDETKVVATGTSNAVSGTYTLNVTQMATAATVSSDSTTPINSTDLFNTSGGKTVTLNGVSIALGTNVTASDIVNTLNEKSGETGVKASYDATAKQISFTSTKTGMNASVNFSTTDTTLSGKFTTFTASGVNAKVSMDGGAVVEFESNTFTYRDISFQLKTGSANVSVTVEPDVNKVYDTIKNFVDKYNDLIDKVNKKVSEKNYRDFPPLTDDQRAAMKDTEIKLWEDKAKSGLLRNDSSLTGMLDKMRTQIATRVDGMATGAYSTLSAIGITTAKPSDTLAKFNYQENGKLYIDENKLKDAIRANPDQVAQLFTKSGSGSTPQDIEKSSGFGERLRGTLDSTLKRLMDISGNPSYQTDQSFYGKRITELSTKIYEENSKLKDIEDRYWKQFAAMESAINKMNSQNQWLSQQLG